jgi:pimeloyl-ACP methyl ester carboxylesterase
MGRLHSAFAAADIRNINFRVVGANEPTLIFVHGFACSLEEGNDAKLRERLVARAQSVNADFREELFLDLIRWDNASAKDVLQHITLPALVLQSTFFDADLKRAPMRAGMTTPWMDLVASSVQKSEAKIIPGAGHFAMIEAAPAVNDAIHTFATKLAS